MTLRPRVGFLVLAFVVAACSGGAKHARNPLPVPRVSTAVVTVPVAPLTGLASTAPTRAALSVELNHFGLHPMTGVNLADVVYEYVVEGGITRLVAVFNSQVPDRIGPIRSVRPTEASIVWPLGGVFAFSGGAPYALNRIDTAPVVRVQENNAGPAMFRDPQVTAPNNLYAHGALLFAKATVQRAPKPLFTYRQPRGAVIGRAVSSFVVGFHNGYAITWTWDDRTGTWTRAFAGRPEMSTDGVHLGAKNVVVLFVTYAGGPGTFGAQANLTGFGDAWVFTDDKLVTGRWSRSNNAGPEQLRDAKGRTIRLTPGSTWVEVLPTSYTVTLSP
jgi:Protein of unknown function (DUF3048) N-terminal domain/Protein of unknown function (DUF3048) C-terminal domain